MAELGWTVPVMRMGYAGRGLTYLAVAGISLFAIWNGGAAQGTTATMEVLSESAAGLIALGLIVVGMAAYGLWRWVDAWNDLECYGSDLKGMIARCGMVVTGAIHGVVAGVAALVMFGSGGQGGGIPAFVARVLALPMGWIVVLGAGALTLGAGLYYVAKGARATYREHLMSNVFTRNWDWALRGGVVAQAIVIGLIGGFLIGAGLSGHAGGTGGVERAFEFLDEQPFGKALVVVVCLGLLGFAFFCFVNAAYRIVPRVAGDGFETLAAAVRRGHDRLRQEM
ncbi:DUF1206 domain-containing protein [Jannaschia marina]|uniref:DUF1206 domain-containing protein n=1 Tax=Jannaschia marina TaxID=2741674 RepID=UPI001F3C6F6C|nr:DUF1206 domain-containing protein [Jannaschia marina]